MPEAKDGDISRAVAAAREAFDRGPWPRMSHVERAGYLRALGAGLQERVGDVGQIWPRESGVVHAFAEMLVAAWASAFDYYAGLADTFPFEEQVTPWMGEFGLIVREPVGVVGAIIPWNGPLVMITYKVAPALGLLSGCTVVLKCSPEAPGEAYVLAEIAQAIGLPAGVLNVVTADREVSELLVMDPRVDKITFTGSTAAGRRIASICGDRIARCTLELGGKSAAVILDDIDIATAAGTLAANECVVSGQVCSSLTRIVVTRNRHDEFVDALTESFAQVQVGDPFDPQTRRARWRLGASGTGSRATSPRASPRGRPSRWRQSPEASGPRLVHRADGVRERRQLLHHRSGGDIRPGPQRHPRRRRAGRHRHRQRHDLRIQRLGVHQRCGNWAHYVARQLRSGTVGHNAFRTDFTMAFGGFKQSGIGREGEPKGCFRSLRPSR